MGRTMKFLSGGVFVLGALAAGIIFSNWDDSIKIVSLGINYFRYMGAPAGTIITEAAAGSKQAMPARQNSSARVSAPDSEQGDWPS